MICINFNDIKNCTKQLFNYIFNYEKDLFPLIFLYNVLPGLHLFKYENCEWVICYNWQPVLGILMLVYKGDFILYQSFLNNIIDGILNIQGHI